MGSVGKDPRVSKEARTPLCGKMATLIAASDLETKAIGRAKGLQTDASAGILTKTVSREREGD